MLIRHEQLQALAREARIRAAALSHPQTLEQLGCAAFWKRWQDLEVQASALGCDEAQSDRYIELGLVHGEDFPHAPDWVQAILGWSCEVETRLSAIEKRSRTEALRGGPTVP